MSDHARKLLSALVDWLHQDARIAVQVFLVIGGFLAAKSLSPDGLPGLKAPLQLIRRRYLKLAPPFLAAMLVAVAASAWAASWMRHDSISAPPGAGQSAALAVPALVAAGVAASLLYFNRDAGWDVWAPYFFGSCGLGALAWWGSDRRRRPHVIALQLPAMLLLPGAALLLDFRSRIALALGVACVLFLFGRHRPGQDEGRTLALINYAGKISFSVFLVVSAAFARFVTAQAHAQALGMLLAWLASLLAGAAQASLVRRP